MKNLKLSRRIHKIRQTISGTADRPRIVIERTAKHFRAQLIDDSVGKTLISAGDHELTNKVTGIKQAEAVGKLFGDKILKIQAKKAVFDRRGLKYHGRVKAFAEAVRTSGVQI